MMIGLAGQRGIGGDEAARTVDARAVMAGARHERQRAARLVLGLGEVPRQRHQHRQAVAVVAGALEPAVVVRVEDDDLVRRAAGNHRDGVLGLRGP